MIYMYVLKNAWKKSTYKNLKTPINKQTKLLFEKSMSRNCD